MDIGCDHGKLVVALVGKVPWAVGIDRHGAEAASMLAESLGVEALFIKGEGFEPVQAWEKGAATAVIAGVGAESIREILIKTPDFVNRLVLQPHRGADRLRGWLLGWRIVAERVVLEEGRWHAVMAAERGEEVGYGEAELAFGKVGLHQDREALVQYLRREEKRCVKARLLRRGELARRLIEEIQDGSA
jgi:tRNA A22 N-methylase